MQKPLRVGIVGAGFFSQFHLDGWRRVPDVEISLLCDTDLDRARTVGERYGVKQTTGDLDQVLSQPLDLIDIITPPATHEIVVSKLLAKRVPLICQKPFGRTIDEATALTELAERQQTALIIHENFRFAPWFREIKRLVNAGHFGSLHAISFRLRPGDGQGPRAYLDRQPYFQTMPRLLIRETAIHFVDTFRFLFGEVRSVSAHLRRLNPVIAGEDAGYVLFDFMNGASGLFDGNRLNGHPTRELRRTMGEAWIEGSAGVMRLDGDARLWWLPHGGEEREHNYDHGLPTFAGGACGALCAHVADHLRHGSALENSARDYLRNLVIEDAIYQSNEQRRVVVLPELTA